MTGTEYSLILGAACAWVGFLGGRIFYWWMITRRRR